MESNKSEKRTRKELPWPVNPGDQSNRSSTLAIEGLKRKKKREVQMTIRDIDYRSLGSTEYSVVLRCMVYNIPMV